MLLIDMEMPKCCSDCPLMYDYLECSLTKSPLNLCAMENERLADCPLSDSIGASVEVTQTE